MNSKVEDYIGRLQQWQSELETLRKLMLDAGLTEELKWSVPCYTFQNYNIALLGNFKEYCCISFVKGVLLKDEQHILTSPGENSQSVRMLRFENLQQIMDRKPAIKAYILEAIEIEKKGLKVERNENTKLIFPEELDAKLAESPEFKTAFEALTPGRQRGYNIYFSAAKQSKSRISRIEKYTDRILKGKGINDCICGHSKRMPNCDGSHKHIK